MTIKTAVPAQAARRIQRRDYILPALVALAGASAAIAGADTTFDPALTQFTIHAPVGRPASAQRPRDGLPAPWLDPRLGALFEFLDDRFGYSLCCGLR